MAPFHLLAVGRLRSYYREAADDYVRRLSRFLTLREREVREAGRAGNVTAQRREEARRLAEAIPEDAVVVVLTREGRGLSSTDLAKQVARWRDAARPVAFLIGGATGLDQALRDRADLCWSLGPLTLPHELARVVVLEQLYRAGSMLAGLPYHKGG